MAASAAKELLEIVPAVQVASMKTVEEVLEAGNGESRSRLYSENGFNEYE